MQLYKRSYYKVDIGIIGVPILQVLLYSKPEGAHHHRESLYNRNINHECVISPAYKKNISLVVCLYIGIPTLIDAPHLLHRTTIMRPAYVPTHAIV